MPKSSKKPVRKANIPAHPAVPAAKEFGDMCVDIYRFAVKSARQGGLDEQSVEQVAFAEIRNLMSACIKESKADWKKYSKATGIHAAYAQVKKPVRRKKVAASGK